MSTHAAAQKRQHNESTLQNTESGKSSQAAGVGLPLFMQANPMASAGVTLQRKCACGGTPGANDECETCNGGKFLQAKLAIGASDDPLEQEADRVADEVLATSSSPMVSGALPRIQRFSGQSTGRTDTAPASVERILASSGRPLESALRQDMGQRFGHDFSNVRVHSGGAAEQSAHDVNANAYTVGHNVVFGAGQYSPGTHEGRRLIAHELTHVVQQSGGHGSLGSPLPSRVQRQERSPPLAEAPEEKPLTRAEERELSQTTSGGIEGNAGEGRFTLYNFAIDNADLKETHTLAIAELADLLSLVPPGTVRLSLRGHTDASGEPYVNNPLSKRRATAVRKTLEKKGYRVDELTWSGEDEPLQSNDSVEGRTHNRRVDILLKPVVTTPTPSDTPDPNPIPDPIPIPIPIPPPSGKDEPPEIKKPPKDWDFFCLRHPIICGAGLLPLLCLIKPVICACLISPTKCIPPIPWPPGGDNDDPDTDKDDKDKDKPPKHHACLEAGLGSVGLPSGTLTAKLKHAFAGQYWMTEPFSMRVKYVHAPEIGCDCACGEYRQELKGYHMRDHATGVMKDEVPPVELGSGPISRTTYREDARDGNRHMPYGHRGRPTNNKDGDEFLPDRPDGCEYEGADEPGMKSSLKGECMEFKFEFRGAAVDACNGDQALNGWHYWTVEGKGCVPKPPPKPKPKPKPKPAPATTETRRASSSGSRRVLRQGCVGQPRRPMYRGS